MIPSQTASLGEKQRPMHVETIYMFPKDKIGPVDLDDIDCCTRTKEEETVLMNSEQGWWWRGMREGLH